MAKAHDEVLTVREAAQVLGLSPDAVRVKAKNGRLASHRTNEGRWLFQRDDVEALKRARDNRQALKRSPVLRKPKPDDAITTREAAEALELSTSYVRQLALSGRIPARRSAGGALLFRYADIDGLRAERRMRPPRRGRKPTFEQDPEQEERSD